jgi:hypothetical protein
MESKRKHACEIQTQCHMQRDQQMFLNVSWDEPPIHRELTRRAGGLFSEQLKLTNWG